MGRPKPFGRDRLGILGGPVGANAALSDTDAEYTIGTSDFMVAATFKFAPQDNVGAHTAGEVMWCSDGAVDWYLFVRASDDRMAIWIDGGTYYGTVDSGVIGRIVDMIVFCDRDGNAYFYRDGDANGSDDISAKSASDLDGTVFNIGGVNGGYGRIDVVSKAVMLKLSGTFPTADERAAIARERYLNPDAESPTLVARTDDATERRVDIRLIDVDQDGTTCPNDGTGGDFTIGGGLRWRNVRTQAERTAVVIPAGDWRCLDVPHNAVNAAADIGCTQGSYIAEAVLNGIGIAMANDMCIRLFDSTDTERIYLYQRGVPGNRWPECEVAVRTNGTDYYTNLNAAGYSLCYADGITVIHWVYDADVNKAYLYFNGQLQKAFAVAVDLDLSGNMYLQFGSTVVLDSTMALRLWNWGGAVAPPSGWEDVLMQRVLNPWTRDGHDFDASAIKGEWECRIDASVSQGASSTLLKNLVNPGTGDLTISGGGTMADSTQIAIRGRG